MRSLVLLAAGSALAAGIVWTAFPPEFALESLPGGNGSAGLSISHHSDDFAVRDLGRCIAAIGDTNGDGADDFLIGSRGVFDPATGVETPQVFVIYGGSQLDGLAHFEINDLYSASGGDGTRGRVIYGTERFIGESCSGAGDINADGYSDFVLIGNPTSYVVYGGPNEVVGPELDVETIEPAGGGDGSRGFQLLLTPVQTEYVTLDRATGGGDINNDGIDDIAVASPQQTVYVIYGRDSGFPAAFDPDTLRPANGGDGTSGIVIIDSEDNQFSFGGAVGLVEDVNGDGIDDLAITAFGPVARTFIVYGAGTTLPALIDVVDLFPVNGGDGTVGIVLDNAAGGSYVDDAGDFNGDGNNDIITFGPEFSNFDLPMISVIFGGPSLAPYFDLNALLPENGGDGSQGMVLEGYRIYNDEFLGEWSAGVCDINGDGFDDIIIAGLNVEESFVVFGSGTPPALLSLFELTSDRGADGTLGFVLRGYDSVAYFTKSVAAGDVNADGRPDLLTADWGANFFSGRADIVFGRGDDDSDGVGDFDDNCIEVSNTDQRDTDNDGFGNICDADLNNDLIVNFADLNLLRQAYFSTPADPHWNENADFDGDGVVGFGDNAIMRSQFFSVPGPSALHNKKQLMSN